jgi:hypothetical protein
MFIVLAYLSLLNKPVEFESNIMQLFNQMSAYKILSSSRLILFARNARTAAIRRLQVRCSIACSVFGPLCAPSLETSSARARFAETVCRRLRLLRTATGDCVLTLPRLALQDGMSLDREQWPRRFHSSTFESVPQQTEKSWLLARRHLLVQRRKCLAELWLSMDPLRFLFGVTDLSTMCETEVQISGSYTMQLFPLIKQVHLSEAPASSDIVRAGFELLCAHVDVQAFQDDSGHIRFCIRNLSSDSL